MELFSKDEIRTYVESKQNDLEREIRGFSDQQICTCDLEEWADYFQSKYCIDPIVLYEDSIKQELSETQIKQYNTWHNYDSYEPEYFFVEGYQITFKIPFDGDENLLYLRPQTFIMSRFPVDSVAAPKGDSLGTIVISMEKTKRDLIAHIDDMNTYVAKQFEGLFNSYRKMIEYANTGIQTYNTGLRQSALKLLEKRKEKANDFAAISRAMSIPMKISKDSPIVDPIPLKRVKREPVNRPTFHSPDPEYCISDKDYENILNIIHSACASMEVTASTFIKNDEEELRDFIIATLGTHYENAVTGETFRKIGKTDIQVIFENKAAFIGECKIWHGIKKFGDAIEQLFGYSTWKDSKTALIVFNKKNKDFSAIRTAIEDWIGENTKQHKVRNGNMWECILYRSDTNSDVKLTIALYDITI